MLATHTSHEIAEWRAHARVNGLMDPELRELLSDIHEQIQLTNHILGAAHLTGEDEENPIPPPIRYRRPWDDIPEDVEE